MFAEVANKLMHYPKDWWEDETHPERKYFLKDVVGEPDDPDEDD